jgi:hypothetical protein
MELIREAKAIRQALEEAFDMPILRHGFTAYNRDYELVWRVPKSFQGPDRGCTYTYLFRACAEAQYTGSFDPSMFPLDDTFIDYTRWQAAGEPNGFVWGVDWADNYPGATYVEGSARAAVWAERLRAPMHEVRVETNTYRLALVFHELCIQRPALATMRSALQSGED